MPNPAFPGYAKLRFPFGKVRPPAVDRTAMEDGMVKQTKVRSRVMVTRQFTVLLNSAADYANFITWFQTDLDYGAKWMDFADPETGGTTVARIVSQLEREVPRRKSLDRWELDIKVEHWSA